MSKAVLPDLNRQEEVLNKDEEIIFGKLNSVLQSEFRKAGALRAEALVTNFQGQSVPAEVSNAYEHAMVKIASIIARAMAFQDILGRVRVIRNVNKQGFDDEKFSRFRFNPKKAFYARIADQLPDFLTLPFQEAIELFAAREPILVDAAAEIHNAYERQQFALTKSVNKHFTKEVQKSITKVLRNQESLEDVIAKFRDEGLSDHYAETVFRTNLKTANMAGRVRQAQDPDLAGFIVAFRYMTAGDTDTRSNHQKMDGYMASIDSPIWRTWTPPSGFS